MAETLCFCHFVRRSRDLNPGCDYSHYSLSRARKSGRNTWFVWRVVLVWLLYGFLRDLVDGLDGVGDIRVSVAVEHFCGAPAHDLADDFGGDVDADGQGCGCGVPARVRRQITDAGGSCGSVISLIKLVTIARQEA